MPRSPPGATSRTPLYRSRSFTSSLSPWPRPWKLNGRHFVQGLYHTLWYSTIVAPTLPRLAVGPYQCSADERSRPALNEAEGCNQWLIDCAEVTEDDWEHARRITDMCVWFAPFGCDDLFTQRWKGASARGQTGEVIERGRRFDVL